jgi:hypothetical protein
LQFSRADAQDYKAGDLNAGPRDVNADAASFDILFDRRRHYA